MAKRKQRKWIITYEDGSEVPYEGDYVFREALKGGDHFMCELLENYEKRKKREAEEEAKKKPNRSNRKRVPKDTGTASEVKKKTIHDYTGEELDALYESDPDEHERLWEEAEMEAINNPDNHGKTN